MSQFLGFQELLRMIWDLKLMFGLTMIRSSAAESKMHFIKQHISFDIAFQGKLKA